MERFLRSIAFFGRFVFVRVLPTGDRAVFFLGFLLYFSIFFFLIEFDVSVAGPGAILFLLRRPGYRVYQVS